MAEALIFGSPEPHIQYTERLAAYVVVKSGDKVAMVQSHEKYFLPGGGSLTLETPEETVVREVYEELGWGLHLIRKIGEAIQYFYSSDDARYYEMRATFFTGEFTDESCMGEHQLHWLPIARAVQACFHECHGWAISQA